MAYEVVESDHLASEQTLELLSYWRVVQEPTSQVSLFLHLIDERGDVVAQHDGLHMATAGLQGGDEFVQLHTVWTVGLAPGTYAWQIGVYDSADPTRRLTISLPAQPQAADRLLLHTISLGE